MDTVSQVIRQNNILNSYISGPCKPNKFSKTIPCKKDEWPYKKINCANGLNNFQYKCSKLDPNICPKISNSNGNPKFENPPFVKCSYPISAFQNSEDVNLWTSEWGKDYSYNNLIMPSFCQLTSSSCSNSSICSRFTSNDKEGSLCRNWSSKNSDISNNIKNKLCNSSSTSFSTNNNFECLCINRSDDPLYQDIKKSLPQNIPDQCWWKPCINSDIHIIPSNLNSQIICPSNICTLINNIISQNNLVQKYGFNVINSKINCLINSPITQPTILRGWIISIVILIFFLLLFIFIWVYSHQNNKN